MNRPAAALGALLLGAAPAGSGAAELFPEVSLHLKGFRYLPAEPEFNWTGWIGAGAGLVRAERVTASFTAEVETILGNVRRPFEANQANYHLELALHRPVRAAELEVFLHHVSRHAIDRPRVRSVDWNLLGLRLSGRPPGWPVRLRGSVGRTTRAGLVGYRWELTAGAEAEPFRTGFVTGVLRLVTVESSAEFPRGDFADVVLEAGNRWKRPAGALDLFAAFEHRNDVFLEVPGSRSWLLLGFRIAFRGP